MEEYVRRAIECGITHLGFSDHVPRRYPDGFEKGWKVKTDEVRLYLEEARRLREKYADRITIYIGYEAEYYPEEENFVENALLYGAEYLILGEHFTSLRDERDDEINRHTVLPSESEERLVKYASVLVEAMKTGLFTHVAHPDIIGFTGDIAVYKRESARICEAALKYGVPLEINLLGIREKRAYPKREFWETAAEVGAPVTIGCDAHRAADTCDESSERIALAMIDELGLKYVGMPTLRPLK